MIGNVDVRKGRLVYVLTLVDVPRALPDKNVLNNLAYRQIFDLRLTNPKT